MSHTDQLVRSGNRLQRQSLLFFQQTRLSGEAFVSETRAASVAFGDEIASATSKLVNTTERSITTLGRALRKEAISWRNLVIKTQDAYVQALKTQVNGLESRAASVREGLRPTALETRVLRTSHDLLGSAQNLVDGRLEQATATETKAKPATSRAGRSPIRNYDQLTAKDVVARIQRLSGQQATALLDYEQTRKNRATVIRAAKQRLAVS